MRVCYNRFWKTSSSSAGIAAGAPGEEGLGGPRGVGGSTVAMAKGKKQKSAKKLALAKAADAETKADGGNDAAPPKLNRPSLAALASAGAPGAASTPSRSGKQLWALDSVKNLAPTATKKRSMFMSAYKSLKRAAGIPSKKDRPALSPAKTSAGELHSPPRGLDGTLPDVRGAKEENALEKISRLDTAKTLAGLRDADAGHRDRRESHAAYLDALRRALPSDYARPERTAKDAEALETLETLETLRDSSETLDARLPAPRVAEASSPLSPPRARFARAVRGLVGDMRRRHEASIATARGMLRSLDALEGLEPAAVAFGRVQRRADTAFWSGLPPVAFAAVERANRAPAVPEEARRPSVPEALGEKRAARASPTHLSTRLSDTSFTASLESRFEKKLSLKLLSPRRKPPTPRVVEARHEERRDAEAKTARESESFAFWASAPASRSASAPASPSGASPRADGSLDARGTLNRFGDSFGNDDHATSTRKGNEAVFPGREARANDPAAAAVAAAASRVRALPASVARRLAAAEAMRGNDAETPEWRAGEQSEQSPGSSSGSSASDELAPRLFRTWVAGHGGSRFSATAERARGDAPKPSAAALAAARARDAARGNRVISSSSIGRNHTSTAPKTTNTSFRRGDESDKYGRAVVSPPPARRAGDLDRLRAMRRRLQAEYEVEAHAMRLRNSRGPSRVPETSPTKSSARKRDDVLGVHSESPRSPGESRAASAKDAEGRRTPPDGNAEEEVWHDLARLGGFASFEEVPSSAKPLDVPSARLRAAYAMEAHRQNGGSFGPGPPRSGRDPTRRDEDDEVAARYSSSSPRGEITPRAVGSPETAKAGFDALFRRREARRAAEANAVRRPRTDGGGTYRR